MKIIQNSSNDETGSKVLKIKMEGDTPNRTSFTKYKEENTDLNEKCR